MARRLRAALPGQRSGALAAAVRVAETELWRLGETTQQSSTLDGVFARAGLPPRPTSWRATSRRGIRTRSPILTCAPLLSELRRRGIKIGVLSNTMWPRGAHEQIFVRDGVYDLIDGAVYSSEIPWVKPHPEAFRAAMRAVGVTDPAACVFVGDRPFDDIHGAKSAGMRAVLVPNSDVPAFAAAEPDAVISRLAELLAHLDRW